MLSQHLKQHPVTLTNYNEREMYQFVSVKFTETNSPGIQKEVVLPVTLN
jgi:hypothetical protein